MSQSPIYRILLIEDDPEFALLLLHFLQDDSSPEEWYCTHVTDIASAVKAIETGNFNAILLDLNLPDSSGEETFLSVQAHAPETPIIMLTVTEDEALAIRSVRAGAQDYQIKGQVTHHSLRRAIRYAIERQETVAQLQKLAMIDDLTGLYNRRGFFSLAEQHLRLALRDGKSLLLILADINGMKTINDSFGHPEGDLALRTVAGAIRKSFRASDILSRVGGDEFAILAIHAKPGDSQMVTERLEQSLVSANHGNDKYELSLCTGTARFDSDTAFSLKELYALADKNLYENKFQKQER